MKNKKGTQEAIWQIIEWIIIILVLGMGVYFLIHFNVIDKLRDAIPGFGNHPQV